MRASRIEQLDLGGRAQASIESRARLDQSAKRFHLLRRRRRIDWKFVEECVDDRFESVLADIEAIVQDFRGKIQAFGGSGIPQFVEQRALVRGRFIAVTDFRNGGRRGCVRTTGYCFATLDRCCGRNRNARDQVPCFAGRTPGRNRTLAATGRKVSQYGEQRHLRDHHNAGRSMQVTHLRATRWCPGRANHQRPIL